MAIHLGCPLPDTSRDTPGRRLGNPPSGPYPLKDVAGLPSLLGLAPGGVYHAALVAKSAVRSYRTLSPLPPKTEALGGGLLSVALSLGSPPPDVIRHRVPVEPGLSSPGCRKTLKGGHPAIWHGAKIDLFGARVKPVFPQLLGKFRSNKKP